MITGSTTLSPRKSAVPRRAVDGLARCLQDGSHLILEKIDETGKLHQQHHQGDAYDQRLKRHNDHEDVADPLGRCPGLEQRVDRQAQSGHQDNCSPDARQLPVFCLAHFRRAAAPAGPAVVKASDSISRFRSSAWIDPYRDYSILRRHAPIPIRETALRVSAVPSLTAYPTGSNLLPRHVLGSHDEGDAQCRIRLPRSWPGCRTPLFQKTLARSSAVIHFKFTGAEPGEWNATIRDGKCEVAQGIPRQRPTITLTADSADFVRIATGDLDPAAAFMEGRIKLQGDAELALKLLPMFRIGAV